ncbi:Uncharacterized protein dnl_19720 [Desulfonema limicola]|uniref:Uncharacterized protein n=1 Tax=Desulfonema limicola TaxID=45656 RepID=A0A975B6H5_9BACT|nr:Uncharacterized protein dnl_19720 [Desulfonema limicola]
MNKNISVNILKIKEELDNVPFWYNVYQKGTCFVDGQKFY